MLTFFREKIAVDNIHNNISEISNRQIQAFVIFPIAQNGAKDIRNLSKSDIEESSDANNSNC
jgi:delta-aminolevulinic acid dehydratase/porphobilinogen synthase